MERKKSDKLGTWKCEMCGNDIEDDEVRPYGDGHCHVIVVPDAWGDPEPAPCGPVRIIKPSTSDTETA